MTGADPPQLNDDLAMDLSLEWLHCNRCKTSNHPLRQNAENPIDFYLTSCTHITCQACLMKENKDVPRGAPQKCPKCHTEARVILIQENDLPQDVIDLFMPLMQHLEDFYRIFQFQFGNAVQLMKHLKKSSQALRIDSQQRLSRETKALADCAALQSRIQVLETENQHLRLQQSSSNVSHGRSQYPQDSRPIRPSSSHSNASFATATSGLRMNAGQRLSMNSPFNDIGIERRSQAARPVTTQSASFTENRAPMYSQQATSRPSHQVSGSSAYGSRQPYTRPTTMTSAQNPYPSQRASGHPMMRPGTAQESVRSAGQSTSRGVPSRPSYSLNSNRRRPSTSATRQPSPQVSRPGLYQSENRFSRFT